MTQFGLPNSNDNAVEQRIEWNNKPNQLKPMPSDDAHVTALKIMKLLGLFSLFNDNN